MANVIFRDCGGNYLESDPENTTYSRYSSILSCKSNGLTIIELEVTGETDDRCQTFYFLPEDTTYYTVTPLIPLQTPIPFTLPVALPLKFKSDTANPPAKPHTFKAGTPAKAEEMNQNFDAIFDYLSR
jgi:hypothetical protein